MWRMRRRIGKKYQNRDRVKRVMWSFAVNGYFLFNGFFKKRCHLVLIFFNTKQRSLTLSGAKQVMSPKSTFFASIFKRIDGG